MGKKESKSAESEEKVVEKEEKVDIETIEEIKEEIQEEKIKLQEVQDRIIELEEEVDSFQERFEDLPSEPLKYYPYRHYVKKIDDISIRTRGKYAGLYPDGICIHYTAGRSRGPEFAGPKYGKSAEKHAYNLMAYQKKQDLSSYLIMDRLGRIYQNFPIDEWGWHVGKSYHDNLGGMLSKKLVGIEIQCAGKVKAATKEDVDAWEDYNKKKLKKGNYYKARWTRVDRGDWFFSEDEVRYGEAVDNCAEGFYHKFTELQERELTRFILWLYKNGRGKFSMSNVFGHDSICKPEGRKSDPGHSLSKTIPQYQKELYEIIK